MTGFDMGYDLFGGLWLIIIWGVPFLLLVWIAKNVLLGKEAEKDEINVDESSPDIS
jgi:hypothetical protein